MNKIRAVDKEQRINVNDRLLILHNMGILKKAIGKKGINQFINNLVSVMETKHIEEDKPISVDYDHLTFIVVKSNVYRTKQIAYLIRYVT